MASRYEVAWVEEGYQCRLTFAFEVNAVDAFRVRRDAEANGAPIEGVTLTYLGPNGERHEARSEADVRGGGRGNALPGIEGEPPQGEQAAERVGDSKPAGGMPPALDALSANGIAMDGQPCCGGAGKGSGRLNRRGGPPGAGDGMPPCGAPAPAPGA